MMAAAVAKPFSRFVRREESNEQGDKIFSISFTSSFLEDATLLETEMELQEELRPLWINDLCSAQVLSIDFQHVRPLQASYGEVWCTVDLYALTALGRVVKQLLHNRRLMSLQVTGAGSKAHLLFEKADSGEFVSTSVSSQGQSRDYLQSVLLLHPGPSLCEGSILPWIHNYCPTKTVLHITSCCSEQSVIFYEQWLTSFPISFTPDSFFCSHWDNATYHQDKRCVHVNQQI